MSQIRKRSIKATSWIYAGFFIGAINTYFLTHKDWFSADENGLTRAMLEIGLLIFAFSSLGVTAYLQKFFPYYEDNLQNEKNDLLAVALIVSLVGFLITCSGLVLLQDIIIRKFSTNSILLVQYFFWIIPLGFFILIYSILESYAYGFHQGVFATLLKETVVRLYTLVVILLKVFNCIQFKTFIILFSLQYAVIFIILSYLLIKKGHFQVHFTISKVTRKYRKKIISMLALTFIVIVVNVLRQSIDGLVLAAKQNLAQVGVFGLAAYMVSVLQAPFRSMVAITVPLLSRAWKNKEYQEIQRIYQRSSINLLTFSLFTFFLIWLNYTNAIHYFNINPIYLEGKWVFFILGLVTIIEMGTGVNGQIIGTSTYWRFELWTSLLLTAMIIPLSYYLTVRYGIFGPAVANLISFTVYNAIRYFFLLKKFKMQPFTLKTLEVTIIACFAYITPYLIFKDQQGIVTMLLSSATFVLIFGTLVIVRNITPDLTPVILAVKNRIRSKKSSY